MCIYTHTHKCHSIHTMYSRCRETAAEEAAPSLKSLTFVDINPREDSAHPKLKYHYSKVEMRESARCLMR